MIPVPGMVPATAQNRAERRRTVQSRKEKPPGKSATYRGATVRGQTYETPALPPELRRRSRGRAGNVQAYGASVKRVAVAAGAIVPVIVPDNRRATSWRSDGLTM